MSGHESQQGWPFEQPRPKIDAFCKRCRVTQGDVDKNLVIVSPSYMAHFGDGGDTACGVDATPSNWWWPL